MTALAQTKQIKSVLRQDPERSLYHASHPGPLLEVDFWIAKSRNLNSIFNQLQVRAAAAGPPAGRRVTPYHITPCCVVYRMSGYVVRCELWMLPPARTPPRSPSCVKTSLRRVWKRTTMFGISNHCGRGWNDLNKRSTSLALCRYGLVRVYA